MNWKRWYARRTYYAAIRETASTILSYEQKPVVNGGYVVYLALPASKSICFVSSLFNGTINSFIVSGIPCCWKQRTVSTTVFGNIVQCSAIQSWFIAIERRDWIVKGSEACLVNDTRVEVRKQSSSPAKRPNDTRSRFHWTSAGFGVVSLKGE